MAGRTTSARSGNIVHALVVINGNCAATTAQLPDVQYRLVRVLGRILGLGWSAGQRERAHAEPTCNEATILPDSVDAFQRSDFLRAD